VAANPFSLVGRVALVTGGNSGIGRAIALAFQEAGAQVAIGARRAQRNEAVLAELGPQAAAFELDVCDEQSVERVIAGVVERFGRLDILVNNASVWLRAPFLEITPEAWQLALDVNLTGPFLTSQAAAAHMLKQESGLIINITDLSAYQTWKEYAHHAASKAGLVALTRVMAAELAPHVRVNAIAPGTVLLPEGATDAKRQWAEGNSLLKRVGRPEDVARTVLFLVDSDFTTGSVYFVDGGRALV
jgi:NAD(P)-dependent dehydrogenase (short-subunit alcohol dehydrogenase family)